ncbi:hypothetical protein GOP47_0007242 [Adiantum capillus-veneris]|uniref:Myb/SANT-like DNA-binding domain-containing protein n=1 Tax=Adiantum capillus-veneris TaxID=13818 RepID=A0A9D4V175_ADICA|nr:hypothetical protein GOP47_0007242 [Adiantum capillus-veneris]
MQAQEVQSNGRHDAPSSLKRTRGGAWKDHWVAMLVDLRGCMNEEFMKPQKQGADMWTRVAAEISAACDGFDKDSESCRKKWQKVYKVYKEDKLRLVQAATIDNPQSTCTTFSCKWFHLIDKYMQSSTHHVNTHSHTSGTSELVFVDDTNHGDIVHGIQEREPAQGAACIDLSHTTDVYDQQGDKMHPVQINHVGSLRLAYTGHVGTMETVLSRGQDHSSHHSDEGDLRGNAKRARRDLNVAQCLSQMAETWRDALEAMKEADAKRLEVLQSLAVTMAGLLDVLKHW